MHSAQTTAWELFDYPCVNLATRGIIDRMNYYTKRDLGGATATTDPSTDPRAVHCFGFTSRTMILRADPANTGDIMYSFDRQQTPGVTIGISSPIMIHGVLAPGDRVQIDTERSHVLTWFEPGAPTSGALVEVSAYADQ